MQLPTWLGRLLGLSEATIKTRDRSGRPFHGIVEVVGTIDDPGAPDHGQVVYHKRRNTITLDSRGIMARALAGDADGFITTVAWGDGTTEPVKEDEALEHELESSAVGSPAAYPTVDSVMFTATLPPGQGTGARFSEIALKAGNGKLFARFTFPGVDKFNRLRLSVTWQIIFVR